MTCTAERVIEIARSDIGYHEGDNNYTPWLDDMFAGYPQMDRYAPWCDKWFDSLIVRGCDYDYEKAEKVLCGTFDDYTVISAQYYKDSGRYGQDPRLGAQIFFRNTSGICHTGVVTGYDTDTVYTIEGNSGDQVCAHEYSLNDWYIDGYGYPQYDEESEEDEMTDFQALIKPDGMEYMIWFDGNEFHDLDNPDEMEAIKMFYKKMTGRNIPCFEFGSPEAPWFHRLQDAHKHTHDYYEHM